MSTKSLSPTKPIFTDLKPFPSHLFRGYDIRGPVVDFSDELVERAGRAYVGFTGAKNIAIGWDMRASSPRIVDALVRGIVAAGANVKKIGMCTTPMIYYAVGSDDAVDGGMMVTASHCGSHMNGIKMCRANVSPIGFGSGMEELRDLAESFDFSDADVVGDVEEIDLKGEFIEHLFSVTGDLDLSDMNIVFDAGNSVGSVVLPEVIERIGCKHTDLYFELDDSFPNHEPNPVKLHTMNDLAEAVRKQGAQIGFSYDGDADRIGVVDENGAPVTCDYVALLIARTFLKDHPGAMILSDGGCTRDLGRVVEKLGGTYGMTPVGHAHIKRELHKKGALFAGELSGHLYFQDMFKAESTMLATLFLLRLMKQTGKKLSELVAEVKTHVHSGEINFDVNSKEGMMEELHEVYGGKENAVVATFDGVRIDFPTWWFNVRPSGNDPVLRLRVEGESQGEMELRRDEITKAIAESEHGGEVSSK
jgi:phosphomannomutase